LKKALADIEAATEGISERHPMLRRSRLAELQGDWTGALQILERAYAINESAGPNSWQIALEAADAALYAEQLPAAMAWRAKAMESFNKFEKDDRESMSGLDACISLYTLDAGALTECLERGCGSVLMETRVRLALLNSGNDDPTKPIHPARNLLRRRLKRSRNVHSQHSYLLTLVDYYLACLRFAAGQRGLDDLFYQQPDEFRVPDRRIDEILFLDLLRRFDRHWRCLELHARWLDGLLQCDFRTKNAQRRRERCKAITEAVGISLAPFN
jgi:hypothetical protein